MSYLDQILGSTKRSRGRQDGLQQLLSSISQTGTPVGAPVIAPGATAPKPAGQGGAPGGGGDVDSWINQALGILGLDNSYAPGVRNMIMKESSGNPRAVNNWDSNAKKGTPSKGLMQTIDPTFRAYALPGYDKDVFDPISNIIAGVRYARSRYGDSMLKQGGRKDANGKYKGY